MKQKEALDYARQRSLETGEEWGVFVVGSTYSAAPVKRCAQGVAFVARYNGGNLESGAPYAGKLPSPGALVPRA